MLFFFFHFSLSILVFIIKCGSRFAEHDYSCRHITAVIVGISTAEYSLHTIECCRVRRLQAIMTLLFRVVFSQCDALDIAAINRVLIIIDFFESFLCNRVDGDFALLNDLISQVLKVKPRDTTICILSSFLDRAEDLLSRAHHLALHMIKLYRLLIVFLDVKLDLQGTVVGLHDSVLIRVISTRCVLCSIVVELIESLLHAVLIIQSC